MKKSIVQYTDKAKAATSRVAYKVKELGTKVSKAAVVKADLAGSSLSMAMKSASVALDGAASVIADNTRQSVASVKVGGQVTGNALSTGLNIAKRSASTVTTAALDQNGDGKFDQEDLQILTKKGVDAAKVVTKEAGNLAKHIAKSELVQAVAGAAAVGAVIASVLPIVGTVTGAAVGAIVGTYGHIKSK